MKLKRIFAALLAGAALLALVGCGTSGSTGKPASSAASTPKDYTQILHDARTDEENEYDMIFTKGEDGKFTQIEGSETFYPHTGVIVSVSQGSESNLVKTTTGIETNQKGLLSVSEDGRTTREGVFAGGDAVMGARTVVEAVAVAKKVAVAMDEYMKSLPADTAADPYADIPVFQTPTSDVLAKQQL